MSGILVVGSVALDSVKTAAGKSVEALGGSAIYFALAASYFAEVALVGVVGEDFPREHRSTLERRGVDLAGMKAAKGKTFRWEGSYGRDATVAKTLATHLNVFREFKPVLSEAQRKMPVVFLANIDPELQAEVLAQMKGPALVACDTMNYWIESKPASIKKLLSKVDIFFSNDQEAMRLTGAPNALQAAEVLRDWGPSVVVIKKGEHGALMMAGAKFFVFPAFPLARIKDPTGAGDTFAGGFLGYLAASNSYKDIEHLKRAMAYGTTLASFNVQDFSTKNIEALERELIDERFHDFTQRLTVPRAKEMLKGRRAVTA